MIPLREMGFEKCKNSEEGRREGQGPVQVTYVKWFLRNNSQNVKCI